MSSFPKTLIDPYYQYQVFSIVKHNTKGSIQPSILASSGEERRETAVFAASVNTRGPLWKGCWDDNIMNMPSWVFVTADSMTHKG